LQAFFKVQKPLFGGSCGGSGDDDDDDDNNNNNNSDTKRNIPRGLSFAITLLHCTYSINKRVEQS